MHTNELLITCSMSPESEPSAWLWDNDNSALNVLKQFKNGGAITPRTLGILGQDYIIGCQFGKPILHIWPLYSQEYSKNKRFILPGVVTCLTVCPKNLYLVAGINCKVYIWQIASGKLLSTHQKNYQPITAIKFSSDGDYLLIAGQDGLLIVYNFAELINTSNSFLTQTDIGAVEPLYIKNDHSMPITDLYVGSFGRKSNFATVSSDQTCRIYNVSDGEALSTLVFSELLTAVTFDAPCWQLFVGNNKGTISQFSLKRSLKKSHHHVDEKNGLTFKGHTGKIVCMALNITNTLLASGSEDGFVYIWEIRSRQIIKKIEHKHPVTNIKFLLGYDSFSSEKIKPSIVLKKLDRNIDSFDTKLSISQIQLHDISVDDDKTSLEKKQSLRSLTAENVKLRCINKQLYNAALEISKKYHQTDIL